MAAEARGGWDARLEALVVDAVIRGEADETVVFSRDHTGQWGAALAAMGIDPVMLSGAAGRA